MFEETIKINNDGTINGLDNITLWDIAKLCEGRDEDEIPRSFGVMTIENINENEREEKYRFEPKNASYSLYMSGGCMVVTAEIDADQTEEINKMMAVISPYIAMKQYAPGNDILTFTLVPLHYSGNFMFLFTAAAFVRAYRKEFGKWEIVMAFDNGNTIPIIAEDIDLKADADYIRAELEEIERINDAKYAKLAAEVKWLEEEQMYQEMIGSIVDQNDDTIESKIQSASREIRIAKDDEEEI